MTRKSNNEVESKLKEQYDEDMKLRVSLFDEEKIDLYQQIRELETAVDHYKTLAIDYFTTSQNQNWEHMEEINLKMKELAQEDLILNEVFHEIDQDTLIPIKQIEPKVILESKEVQAEISIKIDTNEQGVQTDPVTLDSPSVSKAPKRKKSPKHTNKGSSVSNRTARNSKPRHTRNAALGAKSSTTNQFTNSVEEEPIKSSKILEESQENYISQIINHNDTLQSSHRERKAKKRLRDQKACHSSHTRGPKKLYRGSFILKPNNLIIIINN